MSVLEILAYMYLPEELDKTNWLVGRRICREREYGGEVGGFLFYKSLGCIEMFYWSMITVISRDAAKVNGFVFISYQIP